jgi:transcriptional regulator with XRE-family HTH domain
MTTIGQEFKRERELRGISLKEIADTTKISIRHLRALEEDRFDLLPEKFFTFGIIREYAKYIGLDEKSAVKAYQDSLQAQEDVEEESQKKAAGEAFPIILKNIMGIILVLATILAGLALLYFVFLKPDNTESIKPPTPPTQVQKKDIVLPPSPGEELEDKTEGLAMEFSFQQEVWISVYADGQPHFTGLKHPGEGFQVQALSEIVLHTGNAGGFSFTLNGKKGKPFGMSGQVVKNIRITPDNMDQFLEEEPNPGIDETGFL